MLFEWDENKNRSNRIKHGIWFEEARSVFFDSYALVFADESVRSEERFLIIGNDAFGNNLVVVHCYRKDDEVIRIISARRSTKKEKLFYEKRI